MHLRTALAIGTALGEAALAAYVWLRCRLSQVRRDQAGEGVISTAIAVMITAALGALRWVGFKQLWTNASSQTADQISQIGK